MVQPHRNRSRFRKVEEDRINSIPDRSLQLTLGSAGLVENLSLRSPCSSKIWMSRSALATANFWPFEDQAKLVIRFGVS